MPSKHLVLRHLLLLLPSILPGTRVFSNDLALRIRWPKYWSFNTSPSNEYSGLISFRIDWFDVLAVRGTLKKVKVKLLSRVQLFVTPWTVTYQASLSMGFFSGKSTGVGCHFLLQGIFSTQGSNPGLPPCRQMPLPSEPPGENLLQKKHQSIVWKHQFFNSLAFFMVQLSHPYMTTGKAIRLTRQIFVGKVMSLFFLFLFFF